MERLEYGDSLRKDIKRISIKNKRKDIVLTSILWSLLIHSPIAIALFILSLIDISNLPTYTINIYALGTFDVCFCTIRSIIKTKKRKKEAKEAEERIESLSRRIVRDDDSLNTNYMPSITDKTSLTESIQVEATHIDDEKKEIITDFYSLDNKDRILVLREVKKHIKRNHFSTCSDTCELYVLEDADLPEELPVVRRLEVVSHEKN